MFCRHLICGDRALQHIKKGEIVKEYLKFNIKNILPNILNEFDSVVITKNNAVLMVSYQGEGRSVKSILHILRSSTNSYLLVGKKDNVTFYESAKSMDALNKTLTSIFSPLIAN